LQPEIEVRGGWQGEIPEYLHTRRLTSEAVKSGLGRRLEPHGGSPYDVLTRKGQQWADAALNKEEGTPTTIISPRRAVKETVRGFLEKGKTQAEIVRETGLSRQLVSHHVQNLKLSRMAA
jgi:hypothetical protein